VSGNFLPIAAAQGRIPGNQNRSRVGGDAIYVFTYRAGEQSKK
jgi:hypothetical protein